MNRVTQFLALGLAPLWAASAEPPWQVPKSDFGGAVPLNLDHWYSYRDYPGAAVAKGEQGFVTISFTVEVDGRMSDCHVIRSSGFARLDEVPCDVLSKRARFKPAKDANGAPIATRGSTSMAFWSSE